MADVKINEILRGNEYDGVVLIGSRNNALGTPLRTGDIGHNVDPSRLSSVTTVTTGARGQIVFMYRYEPARSR